MFSLGEKQRVLNTNADVVFFDPTAGTTRATTAAIVPTDSFTIKGFGTFNIGDIIDIKCARAKAVALESKDYTVVAPTSIAVGEAVEVKITYKTNRYQGEHSTNYISGGRPIVFQTAALTGVTAANISTAIVAAWSTFIAQFPTATLPINVTAAAAGADFRVLTTTGNESLYVTKVEIRRSVAGAGSFTYATLAVNVTNTTGSEGRGLGKYLEESIKLGTDENRRAYGIDTADTLVDLRGSYTQVYFEVAANYEASTLAAPTPGSDLEGTASHKYSVWLNEATCIASNGAIEMLAQAAVFVAAALPNVSATTIAAPLTRAQEEVEALIYTNDSSKATAAAFIV